MIIENKLSISEFIDQFGHHVNCFERPVCIAMECLLSYSSLSMILFKDYELMFYKKREKFVEETSGIKIKNYKINIKNPRELIKKLEQLIGSDQFIVIAADLYNDKRYQIKGEYDFYNKTHHFHFHLIKGIDYDKKTITIIDEIPIEVCKENKDLQWPYKVTSLTFENFIKNCVLTQKEDYYFEYYLVSKNHDSTKQLIDFLEIYKNYCDELIRKKEAFSNQLMTGIQQYFEGDDFNFGLGIYPKSLTSLYLRNDVINVRYRLFKHVFNDDSDMLKLIDEKYMNLINNYHMLYCMLIKYSMARYANYFDKSMQNMKIILDEEEQLMAFEINLINAYKTGEYFEISSMNKTDIVNEVQFIAIQKLANNKGFGSLEKESQNIDFTGMEQFLLPNEMNRLDVWSIKHLKFCFPNVDKAVYDNIVCKNQVIPIDKQNCNKIYLLGCCDWGSYYGNLKVKYVDGAEETIRIKFSHWADNAAQDEHLAWEGEGMEKVDGNYEKIPVPIKIFAREYSLSKANSNIKLITLPECENMHIFAISIC